MQEKRTRVVIIGGGFGGTYTAMVLEKLLKRDPSVEVGLISKENYLVFQPMLPEVISGSIGIVDTIAPIRRLCPKTNLYTREVESIDLEKKIVTTSAGFRPRPFEVEYDHLVIAVGNITSFAGQPGLAGVMFAVNGAEVEKLVAKRIPLFRLRQDRLQCRCQLAQATVDP